MKHSRKLLVATVLTSGALLLAGCGSGNGGDDSQNGSTPGQGANVATVPDSASASVGAMVAFLRSLVNSENTEPYALGNYGPPKPDNTEPESLT